MVFCTLITRRAVSILMAKKTGNSILCKQNVRDNHAVSYRVAPYPHSKATKVGSQIVGATMWWWILWHLWHEPDHITGEFPYPNSKLWTNAELSVPTDE